MSICCWSAIRWAWCSTAWRDTLRRHARHDDRPRPAVMRGSKKAASSSTCRSAAIRNRQESAFRNAARVMTEVGCAGVKLEGGARWRRRSRFLAERGIPVLGHIGLMPQSVNSRRRLQARSAAPSRRRARSSRTPRRSPTAGAFAHGHRGHGRAARPHTSPACVPVPTIGIGASPACDGQILVTEDVIGLFGEFKPKFVKRYAELGRGVAEAGEPMPKMCAPVASPALEHCFGAKARANRPADEANRWRGARSRPRLCRKCGTCRSSAPSPICGQSWCTLARTRRDGRPGADHGGAARGASGAGPPRPRQSRARVRHPVRQPDPVRPNEDLAAYPRDEAADARQAATAPAPTCSMRPASRRCTRRASPRASRSRA